MQKLVVINAIIVRHKYDCTMMVELSDHSFEDAFTYYPDELHFTSSEVIGLTLEECSKLHFNRDVAYLRS